MKPDTAAATIPFGVELETCVPRAAEVDVGTYHVGIPVIHARSEGRFVKAPRYKNETWKSKFDRSILAPDERFHSAELVSPLMRGGEGVRAVVNFATWAQSIGAATNSSCGCHITVCGRHLAKMRLAYRMTTKTTWPDEFINREVRRYVWLLTRLWQEHCLAFYASSGRARHINSYSLPLPVGAGETTNRMLKLDPKIEAPKLLRGGLNFTKTFTDAGNPIELRCFSGTLDEVRLQHHLAIVLGLAHRAVTCLAVPPFDPKLKRHRTGVGALLSLWDFLGWTNTTLPVAYGLFPPAWQEAKHLADHALATARKFDDDYPDAWEKIIGPAIPAT